MNKLTKIVATIGPSCDTDEKIEALINAGVNVFRFNFKHNSVEWHNDMIAKVNSVASRMKIHIGTLIDLQGPEIRINIDENELTLTEGEMICLREGVAEKDMKGFYITHPEVIPYLKDGQVLKADDGDFEFEVKIEDGHCCLISKTTGVLKQRKTLNIPGADFPFPVLVERDFDGLKLAKRQEVDYVALSFVRSAEDIHVLRKEMDEYQIKAQVVSKIETQKALDDLDAIVEASDGLMVARGDLGVELPNEQVPFYQKMMIQKCIEQGKFVITATQMLQTMITSPQPTRAEISDVANAAYDLTDAVMLSGETASGKYPLEAVKTMAKTVKFNEKKFTFDTRLKYDVRHGGSEGLVCNAAYDMYLKMEEIGQPVAGFIVFTHKGKTARIMASLRPNLPIIAICPEKEIAEGLTVNYGVVPVVEPDHSKDDQEITREKVLEVLDSLKAENMIQSGQQYIVTHGDVWRIEGGTSTVKLITIT